MLIRRTDLAMEAHELWRGGQKTKRLAGVDSRTVFRRGCRITSVTVESEEAARALGKPRGRYVTLDLAPLFKNADDALERAARAVGAELRLLLGGSIHSVLVAGLGNAAMTPDAIGPLSTGHVLVTRHLGEHPVFSALTADALASRSLARLRTTVQLSDTGIVPGSGVGNPRCALEEKTVGVPVYAIGVPTVVDAATLTLDVLEEAGKQGVDPAALRGHETVMVTTRDIDAQVSLLSRIVGYGIDLALQPLSFAEVSALLG